MSIAERRAGLRVVSFIIATPFIVFILYIGFDILAKELDGPGKLFITQLFVSLGRDARFVIGGVLRVIGTVLFFAKVFGYAIRGYRIVKQVIKWNTAGLSIAAPTATV